MEKYIRNGSFYKNKVRNSYGLVLEMEQKGDLNSLENNILAKLYLDKKIEEKDFNETEQKVLRKLLRHPFKIISRKDGKISLTENGKSVAKGYLKALIVDKMLV